MKKAVTKFALRCALGFSALLLFNIAGGGFGMSIGLSVFNTGVVGLLGIPGFALLLVLQLL